MMLSKEIHVDVVKKCVCIYVSMRMHINVYMYVLFICVYILHYFLSTISIMNHVIDSNLSETSLRHLNIAVKHFK